MKLTLGTTGAKPADKPLPADGADGADGVKRAPPANQEDDSIERLMDCNGNSKDADGGSSLASSAMSSPAKAARCGPFCDGKGRPLLLTYNEAPPYLQFNPFILSGYRGYLSTKMCIESVFWWTNETINIWSHIFGWMLFLGLTLYDLLLLNFHASTVDKAIVGGLLICFQACMILSSLYHTFSCRSEKVYDCFLTYDLFGISLSLLAIYMSGIYYAFWCHKAWQTFYLTTVGLIFGLAMSLHVPRVGASANMKLFTFVGWAAYGVVPTFHWTVVMGGLDNPMVQLLLPRVMGMYAISGVAFLIYVTKFPERLLNGSVDYLGHSHQWWHLLVVLALYYWHNTGIQYVEYRMNHGCGYNG
ncbi:progestin and adipoQ receptor family member 3 isoform X2 [Thrips palmi]|nr:progestin and adipoQ receptor family member 3 isoform X2 [Thrips palmi]